MSFGGSPSLFRTTQWHVVTQCLFRGGHGRWLVLFAATAGVAVASTARPNSVARIFLMVPSRELVVNIYGYDLRGPERSEPLADQVRPVPVVALVVPAGRVPTGSGRGGRPQWLYSCQHGTSHAVRVTA